MNDRQAPEWLNVLGRCGLVVTETAPSTGPPVNAALYAVNGIEVQPIIAIPASAPDALGRLDEAWHHHAVRARLYGEHREFLILPPGPGGSRVGWVRVEDPGAENLPSRIRAVTGALEFVAVSVDGRRLCAVTEEDSDYWVVVHEYRSENRTPAPG